MKNYVQKSIEETQGYAETKTVLVVDYMTKDLTTFRPDTQILEVVDTLLEKGITGAPVLNDKKEIVGLVDDKNCLRMLFDGAYHNQPVENKTVAHYMTNVMKTVSPDTDIFEVADIFLTTIYKRLLVVDDRGKLLGQISRRDVLRAIHDFSVM